jgi:methylaspartate mutase epsilon subunit
MGFASPLQMKAGLLAVKSATPAAAGTLTLDSYTRTGDHDAAEQAVAAGRKLNGYPLVALGPETTRAMLDGLVDQNFAVQVRHGSPRPYQIVKTLLRAGLDATEGGPVSYCLPYGRVPLREAVAEWRRCCELLADGTPAGRAAHLETFGGCMLGQLCPPSLLVALSVLEAIFFSGCGLRSVSLSYAQQTDPDQDAEAVLALRHLAGRHLRDVDWHVVIYTYMGLYPRTENGAGRLLRDSVHLATRTRAERLIVKTSVEGFRIPTVADNVRALKVAAAARAEPDSAERSTADARGVLEEASALVGAVLELHDDVGEALLRAFARGYLDVPFCQHPDNADRARSYIDPTGRLQWAHPGLMPVRRAASSGHDRTAGGLLEMLSHVQRRYDGAPDLASAPLQSRQHR